MCTHVPVSHQILKVQATRPLCFPRSALLVPLLQSQSVPNAQESSTLPCPGCGCALSSCLQRFRLLLPCLQRPLPRRLTTNPGELASEVSVDAWYQLVLGSVATVPLLPPAPMRPFGAPHNPQARAFLWAAQPLAEKRGQGDSQAHPGHGMGTNADRCH